MSISGSAGDGLYVGPEISSLIRPHGSTLPEMDIFPPIRSYTNDNTPFLPYIPEDIAFEEEYEEYLSDLNSEDYTTLANPVQSAGFGHTAWTKLDSLPNVAEAISDSESVASLGNIMEEARQEGLELQDENRNDWEVCFAILCSYVYSLLTLFTIIST